ncbi:hypothetical protein KFL_001330150 [Klebsormidium nitens]|uniref:MYND-type domain-containing protein n=1 Tax=Klebsormidium nitens TaxID=105231 RepID=A0A0U9HS68_KLENI|nr:hypothetical protein KFL_001330150 [Klebsormidium nitens]|eukprot:GAQ83032.1 hypothetical protein KFL_001330150 [Klebsormidium nitens]
MDGDFDQLVERLAAMLTSADPEDIKGGASLLYELFLSAGRDTFSRLAQELAAYQGGIILKRLLDGAVTQKDPERQDTDLVTTEFLYARCCQAMGSLSSSKVVVDRYFNKSWESPEGRRVCKCIFLDLSGHLLTRAREIERGQSHLNLFADAWVLAPLECLANFAAHSKVFRQAMKDACEERTLFDRLGFLLSAGIQRTLSRRNAQRIRVLMADVAVTLAFSADSQLWALDRGVLKLIAAVYAVSPGDHRQDALGWEGSPAFLCNAVLLHLLPTESAAEKLRAHNALDGFRPHRRKMNDAAIPELDLWKYFEGKLQGRPVPTIPRDAQTRSLDVRADGAPIVCSWKECTAGPEPPGTAFKRCAGCQVSRYCSKEHQRLHWRTHKVHCRAAHVNQVKEKKASSMGNGEAEPSSSTA